jgi:ribosomal protein S18 acetylase RimI-like enzyme
MVAGTPGSVGIRPLAPDELDRACAVIGLAFADNPSTLATVRGDGRRAERTMRRVVRVAKLTRPASHVLVADQSGEVVGVLNATPWPRCQLSVAQRLRMAPALARALATALPSAAKMMVARARHDPGTAHWHIGPIAVHPEHQGKGVGTALLGAFCAETEATGLPAFLETDVDRNVALYHKVGFEIVDRETILGIDTRFMWRDTSCAPRRDSVRPPP